MVLPEARSVTDTTRTLSSVTEAAAATLVRRDRLDHDEATTAGGAGGFNTTATAFLVTATGVALPVAVLETELVLETARLGGIVLAAVTEPVYWQLD